MTAPIPLAAQWTAELVSSDQVLVRQYADGTVTVATRPTLRDRWSLEEQMTPEVIA